MSQDPYIEGYLDGRAGPPELEPRTDEIVGIPQPKVDLSVKTVTLIVDQAGGYVSEAATRESADDFLGLVCVLNNRWRVIDVTDQWILQYRTSLRPNSWRAPEGIGSFCRARDVLIREIRRKVKKGWDERAMDVIAALPEKHPSASLPVTRDEYSHPVAGSYTIRPSGTVGRRLELWDASDLTDGELATLCRASGLFGTFWTDTEQGRKHLRGMMRFSGGLSEIERRALEQEPAQ